MNEVVNNFLLAGNKFMPEFTYSAGGPITKSKERIQKLKETGDSLYICQKKLDKTCFQHYMGYGDIKDVPRRTTSDKIFLDKAFDIARNPKHDLDINVDLLQ